MTTAAVLPPPEATSWPLVALTGGVVLMLVGAFLAVPKFGGRR